MPERFMPWQLTATRLTPSMMNWGAFPVLLMRAKIWGSCWIRNLVARRTTARHHHDHGKAGADTLTVKFLGTLAANGRLSALPVSFRLFTKNMPDGVDKPLLR